MTRRCFTYGLWMDADFMQTQCPGAIRIGPVALEEYQFFIMKDGYASIRPCAGSVVWGVLWEVTKKHEETIDEEEEVPTLYVKCKLSDLYAFYYLATSLEEGVAKDGYVESIIQSALNARFPLAYIWELSAWLP
ncbi:MAG: gamma-glutamylcyclotransferase family protein [bacterium]|nr:gamma-glutamylcyclotransferase family protein [bacterium]